MAERNKFITIVATVILLITIGTLGYQNLLRVALIDAFYMTVITISTVGFREIMPLTNEAKIFTVFLIFTSLGILGYTFTSITALFMEGKFKTVWRKRKMENRIEKLKNHYVLCGAGETGQSSIKEFLKTQADFVVIDKNEDKIEALVDRGILAILGDATNEETLEKAKIREANGLICSMNNDAENVYTVLTARQMNKDLYIISRAVDKNSPEKLLKAGANNTISPYEIEGKRMASIVLRPSIISFLDVVTQAGEVVLDLEDVVICEKSKMINKSLKELKIPEKTGLIVLAIQRAGSKKMSFNPSSTEVVEADDILIVLGQEEQVNKLRVMACDLGHR
jgi:voltage-gated potassium channel